MTYDTPSWYDEAIATEPEVSTVFVDGCEIAYAAWGSGSSTPVILVHGGGANAVWWYHVAPQLADDRRVIALDLLGHGDSGHREVYSISGWADEVEAVRAAEGMDAFVLIGHSMGGSISLEVASRPSPPLLTVVVDSAISLGAQAQWEWMERLDLKKSKHYPDAETLVRRFRPTPTDERNRPYIVDRIAQHSIMRVWEGWRWKLDPRVFDRPRWDPRSIQHVRGPVALVQAERGTAATDAADVAREVFGQDLFVEVVHDSGHHVMLDQPERLVEILHDRILTCDVETEPSANALFTPLTAGALELPNRVLMAPLTRMRATPPGDVPNDLMAEYYVQRAGAGLIIAEGAQVSPEGKGYMDTPGLYSDEQVVGWRRVTDAVHAAGGRIAAQLWHTGRVSHESLHGGELPVSASARPYRNRTTIRGEDGKPLRVGCPTPRALRAEEVPCVVEDYRAAARNARQAGFDAVEIHAAHGYLLHQFMSAESNHRGDRYGGSLENRARLLLEVVDGVIDAWSADRVAVRISPTIDLNGLDDVDGAEMGLHVAAQLSARGIAFLHVSEADWVGGRALDDSYRRSLRDAFPGTIVGAGAYDVEKAERLIADGVIDAAAFGRWFIANPDLPDRLAHGWPLNEPVPATFYGGDATGYTDYPVFSP